MNIKITLHTMLIAVDMEGDKLGKICFIELLEECTKRSVANNLATL